MVQNTERRDNKFNGLCCRAANSLQTISFALLSFALLVLLTAEVTAWQREQSPLTKSTELSKAPDSLYQTWIEQLADSSFHVRQTADAKLTEAGHKALAALTQAKSHSTYEQRLRIDRLVATIVAAGKVDELSNFLDGKLTLPCWKTYSNLVGDTEQNRHLFVELYRQRGSLLQRIESKEVKSSSLFSELARISDPPHTPESEAALACFSLYISNMEATEGNRQNFTNHFAQANVVYANHGHHLLKSPYAKLHQAVLENWVTFDTNGHSNQLRQLKIAVQLNQEAGLVVARRVLELENNRPKRVSAEAFELVARFGSTDDLELVLQHTKGHSHRVIELERYTDSDNFRHNVQITASDAALSTAIRLVGEQPIDYGFVALSDKSSARADKWQRFAFPSTKERETAIKKWSERSKATTPKTPKPDSSERKPSSQPNSDSSDQSHPPIRGTEPGRVQPQRAPL